MTGDRGPGIADQRTGNLRDRGPTTAQKSNPAIDRREVTEG